MSLSSRDPLDPTTKSSAPSREAIEKALKHEGFENFGFAELTTPVSIDLYEDWLKKGYQGEMAYLSRHLPEKREPQKLLAKARMAIVVTQNYVPHPQPIEIWPLTDSTKVASYARGRDYHHFLAEKLGRVIASLKEIYPSEEFRSFTDSSPVLERDLAKKAGLGWIGKNTCLLNRATGSLFLIAEIYTTMLLPIAHLESPDHCGTCTRCLDACPTGALVNPRELDARKCISYLTIESRELPPVGLRKQMGDWFFGCDICQNVCPWNIKFHGAEKLTPKSAEPLNDADLTQDLRWVLTSSNRALEKAFIGTPLTRAGGFGLKRNALVVAANRGLRELTIEITKIKDDPKLSELAEWALKTLEES
jgi:epoxyqueuosine reductase